MQKRGVNHLRVIQVFNKCKDRRAQESRYNCKEETEGKSLLFRCVYTRAPPSPFCSPPAWNLITEASPAKAVVPANYAPVCFTFSTTRALRDTLADAAVRAMKCTWGEKNESKRTSTKEGSSRCCHCFEWKQQAGNTAKARLCACAG